MSFFYFLVAAIIRIFDLWMAIAVFQKAIRLYFKWFGLDVHYNFPDPALHTASNTVFVLLNQASFLDSFLTPNLPVKKTRGILNIEFALYPILGWFLAITNFVIVRQWSGQAKRTVNRTRQFLISGGNMIISIEGKRSKNGRLSPYKKGPVVMAINSQSDIVPFMIKGAYESLPYGSLYTKPGTITVTVLDPISTKGKTYEDRNELLEELRKVAINNGLV